MNGEMRCLDDVGMLYQQGRGVPVDLSEAMKWYRQAAANGSDSAMYNVGVLYENGLGVTKDREQALLWYRGAARAGNVEAKRTLKSLGVAE